MSRGKHTPGPWNLIWWGNEKHPYPLSILADNNGAWVARDGQVSSESNARLIAAAPDMMEALEVALKNLEQTPDGDKASVIARAAITKAKG